MREVISIHIGQAGIQVSGGGKGSSACTLLQERSMLLFAEHLLSPDLLKLEAVAFRRCVRTPIESGLPVTAGGKCLLGALLPGAR